MIRILLFGTAALAAVLSCENPVVEDPADQSVTVSFSATSERTRTAFGAPEDNVYPVFWQAGDCVKLFVNSAEINTDTDKGVYEVTPSADFASAGFNANFTAPSASSLSFLCMCPAAAYVGTSQNGFRYKIPATQSAGTTSCDPAAMVMAAASGPYESVPSEVGLHFSHVTAYCRIVLEGFDGNVATASIESDKALVGTIRYNHSTGAQSIISGSRKITLTVPSGKEVWFACMPVDLSGTSLRIVASTTGGTLSKSIEFPTGCALQAGQVAKFTVNMGNTEGKTSEFDENNIVFSFGAISDTHVNGVSTDAGQKLSRALQQLKAKASEKDVDGLDAVVVAGDLTDTPGSCAAQTGYFKQIYESQLSPRTVPMIYTVGNHDANPSYAWSNNTISQAKAMSSTLGADYFLCDQDNDMRENFECRDCLVDGYHVLCITPNSVCPVGFYGNVITWLDQKLAAITATDPDRFVFVNTHPMIENTVYGSLLGTSTGTAISSIWNSSAGDYWATHALTEVLSKYPQVVTFGGHLHFPLHDPRSIFQGDFTSFGCGSTSYMAIENGGYEDMSSATVMNDSRSVSDGWLIQLDMSGNMRATAMDFYNSAVIGTPYEIPFPKGDKSHLLFYTSGRALTNTAPHFDAEGLKVSTTRLGSSTSVTMSWKAASDDEFAHHYVLEVKRGETVVVKKKYLTDFYRHPQHSGMKSDWSVSLGTLPAGDYTAKLTAYDSWDASCESTRTFTVESAPAAEPALYVDFSFAGGSATDKKGKVQVTNHDATFTPVQLSYKGQNYQANALQASSGKYIVCQFSEINSTSDMSAFMSAGFTVEALFVDRVRTSDVHGVFCGTQAGGWGLAMRATGVPYFIVGEGTSNTYKSTDAASALSTTELSHVVCVYDPVTSKMYIYVNGTLSSSASITGVYHNGAGDTYNRFCLGADIATGNVGTDFPCSDMVIAGARFYTGALDAAAVKAAYDSSENMLQ